MQDSLSHQLNETICSDLEEFRDRLAAVEAAMEMTAKKGRTRGLRVKRPGEIVVARNRSC